MEPKNLNDEVDRVILFLSGQDPDSETYTNAVQNLRILCEARSKKAASNIDPEVLIAAGVNLLGIVLILRHEQFNVVASKAMTFIRPK